MRNIHIFFLTFVLITFLIEGCNISQKNAQQQQVCQDSVQVAGTIMTNEEKQVLLENKFQKSTYANDTVYKSRSIKLIPTATEEYLYCWIEKNLGYGVDTCILQYDRQKEKWTTMYPKEESEEWVYYNLDEYRLRGNRLYCKFFTGQCGLGLQAVAFEYLDFQEGKWHFLTYCTEASEFVGDSIKADIAWIVKEGENAWETECADSIKWIKME